MRILLSNDDGIHAHGLSVLEKIAKELTDDIWIVAPEIERSGSGHSLTLHRPLRLRQMGERRFAVAGTPTDCVMMAMQHVMQDHPPDLVLSGINHGGNLAEDVTYSGTVAVAMEATLFNLRAIALSLVHEPGQAPEWETVVQHAPSILKKLVQLPFPPYVLMNINFPDIAAHDAPEIRITTQGKRSPSCGSGKASYTSDNLVERTDPRGHQYFWVGNIDYKQTGSQGTDLEAIAQGAISITPLSLDLTHQNSLIGLKEMFS